MTQSGHRYCNHRSEGASIRLLWAWTLFVNMTGTPARRAAFTEFFDLVSYGGGHVRLWHLADVPLALTNVCFEGKNGHDAGDDTISAYDPYRTWRQSLMFFTSAG